MCPTYEFQCKRCKLVTTELYSMSQKPAAILCPNCMEVADSVILGGSGFLLKGHGWGFDRYAGKSNFKFMDGKDDE